MPRQRSEKNLFKLKIGMWAQTIFSWSHTIWTSTTSTMLTCHHASITILTCTSTEMWTRTTKTRMNRAWDVSASASQAPARYLFFFSLFIVNYDAPLPLACKCEVVVVLRVFFTLEKAAMSQLQLPLHHMATTTTTVMDKSRGHRARTQQTMNGEP